jgi:hypothetical protein
MHSTLETHISLFGQPRGPRNNSTQNLDFNKRKIELVGEMVDELGGSYNFRKTMLKKEKETPQL